MGVDPISIGVLIAQQAAAAAAAAQAAVASAAGAVGIGGGTAAGGGLGTAGTTAAGGFTPSLAGAASTIAGVGPQAGLAEGATTAATTAAAAEGAKAGLTPGQAASTAASAAAPAVAQALSSKEGKAAQIKVEKPAVADAAGGLAADRERRRRAPGRGSSILTSPLGLSGQAGQPRTASPGVRALSGTLG